jgi:hypothetical protein
MSCVVLHCLKGKTSVDEITQHAKRRGLQICQACSEENENGVEISCSAKDEKNNNNLAIEEFIRVYQHNPNIAVFYDHDDPRNGKLAKYKSHVRCNLDLDEKLVNGNSIIKPKSPTSTKVVGDGFTAAVAAKYYNFPSSSAVRPIISIISLGGTYQASDMSAYWSKLGLVGNSVPIIVDVSVGGCNPRFTNSGEDLENTLDIQIAAGVVTGNVASPIIRFYKAFNTDLGFYQAINSAIAGIADPVTGRLVPPTTISISWGAPELYYSPNTMKALDQLFASAKKKGIIVCAASGDDGSGDGVSDNILHVDFPASSPNVIACGGTSLTNSFIETAWSWNTDSRSGGGGGISGIWPRPAYQNTANTVPAAITYGTATADSVTGKKEKTVLITGRSVPDVSLNADPKSGWSIFFNGRMSLNSIGGTSCVAPAMAGYFASLQLSTSVASTIHENLYRLYGNEQQQLAIVSPPLSVWEQVTHPVIFPSSSSSATIVKMFNDIVVGSNDSISGYTNAYSAKSNYDHVTGLGSINGSALATKLKSTAALAAPTVKVETKETKVAPAEKVDTKAAPAEKVDTKEKKKTKSAPAEKKKQENKKEKVTPTEEKTKQVKKSSGIFNKLFN